ncbi:hypothetical protein EK904_000727 [Melospiza melodia maxima]|nr:hypothetical protein EK904_000727 [Melospiza melodia maxima]
MAFVYSVRWHPSLPKDSLWCDSSILPSSYTIMCLSPLVPSHIPRPLSQTPGTGEEKDGRNSSADVQKYPIRKIPAHGCETHENGQSGPGHGEAWALFSGRGDGSVLVPSPGELSCHLPWQGRTTGIMAVPFCTLKGLAFHVQFVKSLRAFQG